jgi:hypothetical protein
VVRENGNASREYRLLKGPFTNDHVGALAAVDAARKQACELDSRAEWYLFGTVRMDKDHGPGILDKLVDNTDHRR